MQLGKKETLLIQKLRQTIGMNIHMARVKRGMTMRNFARNTGINPRTLDLYEIGKDEIEFRHMAKIATVLGMDLEDLLGK